MSYRSESKIVLDKLQKCLSINRVKIFSGGRIVWYINGNVYTRGSVLHTHAAELMFEMASLESQLMFWILKYTSSLWLWSN